MTDLRYPIGPFNAPSTITPESRAEWIAQLAGAADSVRAALAGLSDAQLDTPYRDGGWTVRQVVHHLPDSHANCYVRFRMALTEDTPTIKPYDEQAWAELADARTEPVEGSIQLLDAMHRRWVALLGSLTPQDLQREYRHPEFGTLRTLDTTLAMYAWHVRHHVAHIQGLRQRMGW